MSIVVQPDGGRQSAWQDEPVQNFQVSKSEMQLLLHLRMLGPGVRAVRVVKAGKGMRGLREYRVLEVCTPVQQGAEQE